MATTREELIGAVDDALLRGLQDAQTAITNSDNSAKASAARLISSLAYASWVVRHGNPPPEPEPLYPPDY